MSVKAGLSKLKSPNKAILTLEDGSVFKGFGFGAKGQSVAEIVFNTSMTGYQEILTDPSYFQQLIVLTYPHIGNTGINQEDCESNKIWCSGLIIRDYPLQASNWRRELTLHDWMVTNNLVGIYGIDTRQLTNILRQKGAMAGCIINEEYDEQQAIKQAQSFKGLLNADLAKIVSTKNIYDWEEGTWEIAKGYQKYPKSHFKGTMIVYDYGVKKNMLRLLVDRGYRLKVVPAQLPAKEVLAMKPDGVLLSNGPGDPAPCDYAIKNIKQLIKAKIPIIGICLGHQLLALATGAKTVKMKFGHHGANHPVRDLNNKVSISSQNHGFAVDEKSIPDDFEVSHCSLFDNTVQGIRHKSLPIIGFQGHPEASPGPFDMSGFFDEFEKLMHQ